MVNDRFRQQVAGLRHGDHICMIYDNRADQMATAVPFIKSGLTAGECCVYIADDQTVEEVLLSLAGSGIDVAAYQDCGALRLLNKTEAYLRTGQFDPLGMIEFLGSAVEQACAAGFTGFRVTGEMTWALGGEIGCDRLIEYEALLNRFFPGNRALALCQYNRQRFSPSVIHDVLRTHPRAVLGQQICENLYYEPPEVLLSPRYEAQRVDWMINQLKRRDQELAERQQMEELLRETEQRFCRFMQHLPGLAWIKDTKGRYVFANEAAQRAFQLSAGQLYGRTDDEVFSPETAARFKKNDRQALKRQAAVHVEETLAQADGVVHHSLVTKFPIPGADGQTALIGGMAIDITEQKRAERAVRNSERIYRALGESIDYGVWVCDPEGRNIYTSDSFLRLVGMTQEECANFGWGTVLHPDDAERTIAAWQKCVRTMGVWDIEHRFRGVDGDYHPVLARGVPVKDDDGKLICWAGINLDIRRMKEAENALRDADRRKDEFLAMLAHELRNPLAPIRSGLDLLTLGEVTSEVIGLMNRQVENLVRLVDDLLDVSRIMRGKIELHKVPVDLAQVVASAVETARPLIDAQRHQLTRSLPPEPVWLHADPMRLTQAISNLLNNAAKYTDPGGHIWLTATLAGDQVAISVRDNGVGMETALLPRIFDLFMQARHSIDRSQGGLGIGLTVVKSLVDMHDGTISASSEGPGKGSEFIVRLPVLTASKTALLGHSPRVYRGTGVKE